MTLSFIVYDYKVVSASNQSQLYDDEKIQLNDFDSVYYQEEKWRQEEVDPENRP